MKRFTIFLYIIILGIFSAGLVNAALTGIDGEVVYDDETQLYWTASSALFSGDQYQLQDAQLLVSQSTFYGFDDWQTPTYNQYRDLITNFADNGTTPFLSFPISRIEGNTITYGRWFDRNGMYIWIKSEWEIYNFGLTRVVWSVEEPTFRAVRGYIWMVSEGHQVPVPIPSSPLLLGSSLMGTAAVKRRLSRKH